LLQIKAKKLQQNKARQVKQNIFKVTLSKKPKWFVLPQIKAKI